MHLNNYCRLPFKSLSIDARGDIRPCCNAYDAQFGIFIKNLEIDEILNNHRIIKIRKNFIEDKRSKECKRCWNLDDNGLQSYRKLHAEWNQEENSFQTPPKEIINIDDIEYIDLTLGNKCNLACRMCNPYSSSLLAKNQIELDLYQDDSGKKGVIDFSTDEENKILEIISKAKNLNNLYFIGGEPLINDFHDKILKFLIESGKSKDIWVRYNTNLQVDCKKYLSYWKHFKKCSVSISIDGVNEIYEYIRWPGKFSKILENISLLKVYKEEIDNIDMGVSVVNQNLNVTNIVKLVDQFRVFDLHNNIWFMNVTGGYYLECVPTYILEQEIINLNDNLVDYSLKSSLIKTYEVAYEKSKNLPFEIVNNFFKISKKYDLYRKQNLFTTLPFMKNLADTFQIPTW